MQLALARGDADAAADIEHQELPRALANARLSAPDAVDEAALFAREIERVENAAMTAELLSPLLAELLRPLLERAKDRPFEPTIRADVPRGTAPTASAPPRAIDSPPQIADLIEGMLTQQCPRVAPPRS